MTDSVRIADKLVSLQDVLDAKPETAWYSVHTCWWTTNPEHLEQIRVLLNEPRDGVPVDPSRSPLFMAPALDFIKDAQNNVEHYGKHGIDAFMLAYHGNVVASDDPRLPRCAAEWESYNKLLDEAVPVD